MVDVFSGQVIGPSHEGGLLISFQGSFPALGTQLVTTDGLRLGRVDTVLGPLSNPQAHILPVDAKDLPKAGTKVKIGPRRAKGETKKRKESRPTNKPRYQHGERVDDSRQSTRFRDSNLKGRRGGSRDVTGRRHSSAGKRGPSRKFYGRKGQRRR